MRFGFNTFFGFFIFLAVVVLSIVMQSTLINKILSSYLYPDLITIIVLYIGLRRELLEGVIWTLFISYLYSMHSGLTPIASSLLMLLVLFASRYIGRNFYLLRVKDYLWGLFVPVAAQKLALFFWLYWNAFNVSFLPFIKTISTSITTTLVGLLMLKMLTALDIWSGRLDDSTLIGKKG